MSTESIMDLTLDTRTTLPEDFTCSCEILILSPYLIELPDWFLYVNEFVKTLDMSKCTNITIISFNFCGYSNIDNIIWPPNIKIIQSSCLYNNMCIQKIDLSYCDQLTLIEDGFCENTNITDITLSVSIQTISFDFLCNNKVLTHLDLSYCIQLTSIGFGFFENTNIQSIRFPKSLQRINNNICYNSILQELDFSECKDIKIDTYMMCKVNTLKLYSIDNIATFYKIQCENLHIYNVTKTKYLDLSFIKGLQNVYLPEGEYCIVKNQSKDYSNVNFWLGDFIYTANHFKDTSLHIHKYLPISKLAMLDPQLETI
jgi:hypothetical protein